MFMPSYYEILHVPTTASAAEIQTAYEQQYNKWRRLVTHHDPNVVNQANQALQALETIRTTLTDPSKRAGYDAGIGLSRVGELADPTAILRKIPPTPPSPERVSETAKDLHPRVDVWICPQCNAPSAVGMRFCKNCGQSIGAEYPNCAKMVEVGARFCPHCGTNIIKPPENKKDREQQIVNDWIMSVEKQNAQGSAQYAAIATCWATATYEQVFSNITQSLNAFRFAARTFQVVSADPQRGIIVLDGQGFLLGNTTVHAYILKLGQMQGTPIILRCYFEGASPTPKNFEGTILNGLLEQLQKSMELHSYP
jgi:hypothetical protein